MKKRSWHHRTDVSVSVTQDLEGFVADAKGGDREAFEQLFKFFHRDVFRMVYYRTLSVLDAQDITQDVFLQAFEKLRELRDTSRFKSWLFRMAMNRVADFHRKRKLLRLLGLYNPRSLEAKDVMWGKSSRTEIENGLTKKEFWERVRRFTGRLSRWEREVFMLRFMDHLTIGEIAEVLDKNESTVKTHLYRALQKFRNSKEFLEELQGERK